jgi:hypothetical protein
MVDKRLEIGIVATQQFLELWVKFFDMMVQSRRADKITPDVEVSFLQIKSELARRFRVLEGQLGVESSLDTNTMNIVGSAISLDSLRSSSDVAMKKLENEWHRAYISINESLGVLQNKREILAGKTQFDMFMDNMKTGSGGKNMMVIVVVIGIIVVLVVLGQMGMLGRLGELYKGLF